jgi:hypothetical protein
MVDTDRSLADHRGHTQTNRQSEDTTMSRDDYDDPADDRYEDEVGPRRRPARSNGLATAALVLGIVSLCLGPLLGLPAIICGILGLTKVSDTRSGKGASIAGIVLGVVGMIVLPIAVLLPAVSKVRLAAAKAKDSNNLKMMALGLHNANDDMGRLPGPFVTDGNGAINRGLSWRVTLLSYIEQGGLHRQFKLDQAWDSPANTSVSQTPVQWYLSTSDPADNMTRYRAFVGPGTAFDDEKPIGLGAGFPDGLANTILFVETADRVPWAAPQDVPYQPNGPLPALGHPSRSVFLVAMGDASVRQVKKTINPAVLHALITRNGNETLPPNWDQ